MMEEATILGGSSQPHLSNKKRVLFVWFRVGNEILHKYMGIIFINHEIIVGFLRGGYSRGGGVPGGP